MNAKLFIELTLDIQHEGGSQWDYFRAIELPEYVFITSPSEIPAIVKKYDDALAAAGHGDTSEWDEIPGPAFVRGVTILRATKDEEGEISVACVSDELYDAVPAESRILVAQGRREESYQYGSAIYACAVEAAETLTA